MIYNEVLLMESDDDSPIVADIAIGNDILDNLVIKLSYSVYESGIRPDKDVCAVIDSDSLASLAKHLRIAVHEVKQYLVDKFSYGGYISRTATVREEFHNILNFILDNGGKYRLEYD